MNQTQELIYQQKIKELKEENQTLKDQVNAFKESISLLEAEVDVKGVDMIAAIKEFQQMTKETRENLRELKRLKQELIRQRAEYELRMEEAVRNIIGDF